MPHALSEHFSLILVSATTTPVVKSIIVTKPAISPARILGSGILPTEFNADGGYIVQE